MSKMLIGFGVVVAVVVVIAFSFSGNESSSQQDLQNTTEINSSIATDLNGVIATAIERQQRGEAVVIDVRTDQEWNEGHATDALHWGLVEHLENGEMPELDKDTEIYVTCRSGNRAQQAIDIMADAGFTNLTNIGGLNDWIDAGGQTTQGIDGDNQ